MGGSALRGMAFGKPLVVQGELGFWKGCRPETAPEFLAGGWYGRGPGDEGVARLTSELGPLLTDSGYRGSIGDFSRQLVAENFGLAAAARVQAEVYQRAVAVRRPPRAGELAGMAARLAGYKVHRRVQRLRGRHAVDDFNALAAMSPNP
jgi:hypothetical protein